VFEYIGEDEQKIGDESRSYLGEHIFKQVFSIYATEEDRRERIGKRDREAFNKLGKEIKGSKLQMDQQRNRGAGSDSIHKSESVSSGAQNIDRGVKSKTGSGV
jgi:dephospho-CoA kinase